MRHSYPKIFSSVILILLSACEQNGGVMPFKGQDLLSSLDGPKIPTMEDNQREAAKNAEKNDDFAGASQIYQQILEKDPETNDVVQLLADSLRRNGEYDEAISVYDGLLTKDVNNISAKEGKALAFLAKGDFETPTSLFEEVLKVDAKRWKSLNGMGILFVTRGLYPDSKKYFEEAMRQSPANTSVMNNLGLSQALNKQYEPAIDSLLKASAQSTISSLGRKRIDLNLALVYASAGKLDEARKIAEIYLNGPSLNNNLGLYAHLAKDDGLAKSYLNMALTESKTYYGKAWDNLEVLNSNENSNDNKNTVKDENQTTEKPTEKTKKEKTKAKKSKDTTKEKPAKVTVIQEPIATKSEVKSIGEIIAHELKKDDKTPAATIKVDGNKAKSETPLVIMPNEIKQEEKRPAVDNVIDDMVKGVTPKTITTTEKPTEKTVGKSLGTIKMPASKTPNPKIDDTIVTNPSKDNLEKE